MSEILNDIVNSLGTQFILSIITINVILVAALGATSYLIMLERKLSAWIQDRVGPNRTGFSFGVLPLKHHFWGFGQPLADGIKLLLKEDYTPPGVDKKLFILAPILSVIPAMVGWAVIPWGGFLQWGNEVLLVAGAPINIGVIYILAIGSVAVYGVVLAGYASNNKYSFLGGLRATAQMLSYEIPMGLCVLIVILLSNGAARADEIAGLQTEHIFGWNIVYYPLIAIIFFTCSLAECNRAPFDLAECEQELVGGFHTEYASMKWALFFLGEYIHMITGCAFFTLLFLGGWDIPFFPDPMSGGILMVAIHVLVYFFKVFLLLFLMMWIRWTLPRFRFDQLMNLAWRYLVPIMVFLLLIAGLIVTFVDRSKWDIYMMFANYATFAASLVIYQVLPAGPNPNRRIPLKGSRFSPVA